MTAGREAEVRKFVLAAAVMALPVATCDGGDGELVGPPVPATVTVSPQTAVLDALGDTAVLVARVLDQNGSAMSGATVSWSSGDESVATVSAAGVVTAVGNGAAVVTARAGGATGQARAVVEQRVVSLVVLQDSLVFDALGDTVSLVADARDPNGASVSGDIVSWSSGDESVATVSAAGLVTTVGNGTAVVTASAGGFADQVRVVVEQRVASVSVAPDSLRFDALGDTTSLVAEVLDPNGAAVAGAAVSWSSDDGLVATVSGAGLVATVGNGAAVVTASVNGFADQARIVVEQRVAFVVVEPDSLRFDALGDSASLVAEALDPNGTAVAGTEVSWSSGDESVATVSVDGVVTSARNGTAAVTASADGVTDAVQVFVEQRVASVVAGSVSGSDLLRFEALGDTASLVAEARDANGALVTGAVVSWSSGDESVATASAAGVVAAVGNGTAAVTARADGAEGAVRVVVKQRAASVLAVPDSVRFDALGDTVLLVAEARDANGTVVAGAAVSWSSENESVATVNADGVVTAAGNGAAAVTANVDGATGGVRVFVEQRIASVIVAPDPLTFEALGDTASMAAEVLDPNGAVVTGAAVSWSSEDESVATVSGNGLVTSAGNGAAAVTATVEGISDHADVVVAQRVASVVVSPASLEFGALGDAGQLAAEPLDSNGTPVLGAEVSWSSENERVATVSGDGLVTAVGTGATAVTASADGATGQARVVVERRVASVVLTPALLMFRALGDTASLIAEALDTNGEGIAGLPVTWASGDESVATVSSNGLVTSAGNGTTAITARVEGHQGLADIEVDTVPHPDEAGLVELYNTTNGSSWTNSGNWLTDAPINEWYGVGTGANERVSSLNLASNGLAGAIPPELGSLSFLRQLNLSDNDLTGPLPDEMTSLSILETISVDADVCAPRTPAFESWLNGIDSHNLGYCYVRPPGVDKSIAYLMQATQNSNRRVRLVGGDPALLRVFVTADNPDSVGIPPVRATFYSGGSVVHTAEIPAQPNNPIPAVVDESSFARSANVEIPGSVVTSGLEMVVEIDPDGTLGSSVAVVSRIPATGRIRLSVHDFRDFNLTVVPFLLTSDPDSTLLDLTDELDADHELFYFMRMLLPIGGMNVTVHDPVWVSSRSGYTLINVVGALREAAGYTGGTWMGMLNQFSDVSGLAVSPGRYFISVPNAKTAGHELGHSLSLSHAPCGLVGSVDPDFPQSDGSIGVWGWAPGTTTLFPPGTPDIMGYCDNAWISGYHYGLAYRHRVNTERFETERLEDASRAGAYQPGSAATGQQALLLWGGAKADGSVYLNPAFVIDASPSLPEAGGEYRVVGEAEDGSLLFSRDFDMQETADGDGGSVFAFMLSVSPSWAETLARITLTGGDSSAFLGREGDEAAILLRDPETGQIRGLLLDLPTDPAVQADWLAPMRTENLDVQVSRGIPAGEIWQR